MRSIYCTECGAKSEYTVSAPKFCSSCGTPMGAESKKLATAKEDKPTKQRTNTPPPLPKSRNQRRSMHREESLADDETDFDYVPDISKLQYDIDVPQDNIKSFRDIIHEQKESS